MTENNSKRISVLNLIFILIALGIGWRLFQKQILEHSSFLVKAQNQYMIKQKIDPERGKILTSDKFPLATNTQMYQVIASPVSMENQEETAHELAPLLGDPQKEIFIKINNQKYYVRLKDRLTEEQGQQIADLHLKGIVIIPQSVRVYPEKELAAQVLGFVNADGEGRYGLEGYYNQELKGSGGEIAGEKDTKGRIFDINEQISPQNGKDLVLTLDHNIQYQAEEVLKGAIDDYKPDSGSLTIIEPQTGKILAMASWPTFDPNEYNKVAPDQQNVFNNSVISSAYEPGSVFKPLIMAAAINEKKVEPDTEEVFSNKVVVTGYEIHTSTDKAYGKETMTEVLENSDNVAMVWVSDQLGKDLVYKYLKDYGFGKKSGIELDSESPGEIPLFKWWRDVTRATISFGQGLTVTPIQLLTAAASIANGGKLVQPYLVDKTVDFSGKEDQRKPQEIRQVISAETASKVTDMMVSVVQKGHGKLAGVSGYDVAGKTGTAQIPKAGGGYYDDRHIGSFIGFAPAKDPKFVMLVRLDQPKSVEWAEQSAAPVFGKMADWLLKYLQVPPNN